MDDLYGIWLIMYKTYYKSGPVTEREAIYTGTMGEWYLEQCKKDKNFTITNQFKLSEKTAEKILEDW